MIDAGLYITYIFMVVAVGAAVIFVIINALNAPGALVKSLIGIGIFAVMFGISYAISSSKVLPTQAALGITEGSSKLIGAGLIMLYLCLFGAIIGLIYSEISKALK